MNAKRQTVVLHSVVREGYEAAHQRIPEGLVESFARVGVHDWRIWRSGKHMIHVVECDDFPAAIAALADDPADAEWQRQIGPFVETYLDSDGLEGFAPLDQVWTLSGQREQSV